MTHDERRLLILVTRMLLRDESETSKSAIEAEKLVLRIQRHASIENGKRAAELAGVR